MNYAWLHYLTDKLHGITHLYIFLYVASFLKCTFLCNGTHSDVSNFSVFSSLLQTAGEQDRLAKHKARDEICRNNEAAMISQHN